MNTSTSFINASVDSVVSFISKSLPELRKLCIEAGHDKKEVSSRNKEFCVGMLLKPMESEAPVTPELEIPLVLRPESEALRRHIINQGSFRLISREENGIRKVYGCLRFNRSDWNKPENRLAIQMFLTQERTKKDGTKGSLCRVIETSTDLKSGYGQIILFSSVKMYESLADHCVMPLFPEWMTIRLQEEAVRQSELWSLLRKRQENAQQWAEKKAQSPKPILKGASTPVQQSVPEDDTFIQEDIIVSVSADYESIPM